MSDTPEMELMTELCCEHEHPRDAAMDLLVAIDFSGWVLTRKSALHKLCRAAGVDYDEFDPTDGGRAEAPMSEDDEI